MDELDELVRLDDSWGRGDLTMGEVNAKLSDAATQLQTLVGRTGAGADFTGWIDLPVNTPDRVLQDIDTIAASLRSNSEVVVVCGIGGSYLGARAGLEFLGSQPASTGHGTNPEVAFAGTSLSASQLLELMAKLTDRRFSVVVISKSGTTLETAVTFHVLRDELIRRFGKAVARSRIVAITDANHGVLRKLANDEGFAVLDLPGDVGGRYSVLTAVGLLPFAIRGFDIRMILRGAAEQRASSLTAPAELNGALRYAALRRLLNSRGKSVELFASFEPAFHYVGEWWKQLFGESEGKDGKGLFPASADYTTDLHSLGQFVQEGTRCLFETVIDAMASADMTFTSASNSPDGLGYLNGRTLSQMNRDTKAGTILAHRDGGVPVLQLLIPDFTERSFGALVYFMEVACAVGGYLLGINPFDQPGVEAYKRNMFALLGKPGTEADAAAIRSRLRAEN
ncbi:glucose-6-phosphate isomerase [bacterium]|nr:glucose-6-phosphate isomerase [bacterium]